MARTRHYHELRRLESFLERYEYLAIRGEVGAATFGFDRWVNQNFYGSAEWKAVRHEVILRDEGCDLGVMGYEIHHGLLIHHMNPITAEDIQHGSDFLLNPDYLITTTQRTHNAIHFGDESQLRLPYKPRQAGDTALW